MDKNILTREDVEKMIRDQVIRSEPDFLEPKDGPLRPPFSMREGGEPKPVPSRLKREKIIASLREGGEEESREEAGEEV
jgi:hypothetical protein